MFEVFDIVTLLINHILLLFCLLGTSAFFLIPYFSICYSIYLAFEFKSFSVDFFFKKGLSISYFCECYTISGLFAIFIPFYLAALKVDLSDRVSKLDAWLWINKRNYRLRVVERWDWWKIVVLFLIERVILSFGLDCLFSLQL